MNSSKVIKNLEFPYIKKGAKKIKENMSAFLGAI